MCLYFEQWFEDNTTQKVFDLIQAGKILEAKLLNDEIYRKQRILWQQVSNQSNAVFGPIERLDTRSIGIIVDDRTSNEETYLSKLKFLLKLIKDQLKFNKRLELLSVISLSGKRCEPITKYDLEATSVNSCIEKLKSSLLGAFDKSQSYWTNQLNSSVYTAYKELVSSDEFTLVLITQSGTDDNNFEDKKFLTFISQPHTNHHYTPQIVYSCFDCENYNVQDADNSVFYHTYEYSSKTFQNPLIDRLMNVGDELKKLAKVISRLEYENSSTELVTITESNGTKSNLAFEKKFLPKSSSEWLKLYGLKKCKLSLPLFLKKFTVSKSNSQFVPAVGKNVNSKVFSGTRLVTYGNKKLSITKNDIEKYKTDLETFKNSLRQRLKWLASSSRAVFGTITSPCPVLLFDISSENHIYLDFLQHNFTNLVSEQLSRCHAFNLACCSSDQNHIFHSGLVPVNEENLNSLIDFFRAACSRASGDRSFAAAKEILNPEVDAYLYVTGSLNIHDETENINFVKNLNCTLISISGKNIFITDYDSNHDDIDAPLLTEDADIAGDQLRNLSDGKFHWICVDRGLVESTDVNILLDEADRVAFADDAIQNLEEQIERLDQAKSGSVVNVKQAKLKLKESKIPEVALIKRKEPKKLKPRSDGVIKIPDIVFPSQEEYVTSKKWLSENSLRSKGISLDKFTKRKCLTHRTENIKSIGTTVKAKWYEGSFPVTGRRHIDLTLKQLNQLKNQYTKAIKRYSQRILWTVKDHVRSQLGSFTGSLKGHLIIAIEACDLTTEFKSLLERLLFQQILQLRNLPHYRFNMCCFSGSSDPQFWMKPDFSSVIADQNSIADAKLWIDCLESLPADSSIVGLETLVKNLPNDTKIIIISNRKKSSTEFQFSVDQVAVIPKRKDRKGPKISSVICSNPYIDSEVADAYKMLSTNIFTALSIERQNVISEAIRKGTDSFTKPDWSNLQVLDQNEYRLPDLNGKNSELELIFKEFNKAISSLSDLAETYRVASEFYNQKY